MAHSLYFSWLLFDPDSSDEDTDDEDDRYRATLRWWDSSGSLVRVQKKVHPGGIYGMQLIPETNQIVTCGKKGEIVLWNLITNEQNLPLLKEVRLLLLSPVCQWVE